eukprot:TRINITY_DN57652_c0_g1_i1.p1 TRINITY_DN57652_c0_g1~~TRINITY_DN57652_c0_g1_i1.p1  ORF type:complete len:272 (+),score=31.88 TRINITY_DN57652_c0_g1_i1:98-817(+)
MVELRDGDWFCAECNNLNFARRIACNKCGHKKNTDRRGKPSAGFDREIQSRIWIGGLPSNIKEVDLEKTFFPFGHIKSVKIKQTANDTFAFVQYDTVSSARLATLNMDQSTKFSGWINGGPIKVAMARENAADFRDRGGRSLSPRQSTRSRSPRQRAAIRVLPIVKFANLPIDMEKDELHNYGSDFGRVIYSKVWTFREQKYGRLDFTCVEDAVEATYQLDDRRVDGWCKRLKAYMPCM